MLQAQITRALQQQRQPGGNHTGPLPPNLVVMSYEHLRSDVEWVSSITWLYCVLDEGHIIKSPKSKITQVSAQYMARYLKC